MLRLPFRARSARPATPVRTRLQFEELGGRYAPANFFFSLQAGGSATVGDVSNARIEGIAVDTSAGLRTISGRIVGYTPGMTITTQGGGATGASVEINTQTGEFWITFVPNYAATGIYLLDANGNEIDNEIVTY